MVDEYMSPGADDPMAQKPITPIAAMMGGAKADERMRTNEAEDFVKPELAVEMNQEALAALAEEFPESAEMFARFAELPPLKFEPGKVNFIFGPNGSGKSTLANAIFLSAKIAHRAEEETDNPVSFSFTKSERKELTAEEIQEKAMRAELHPNRMDGYKVAELIGMAAAPRMVETGALSITNFQARKGLGSDRNLKSDTPIIHRIAVQDILGRERDVQMSGMAGEMALNARYANITGPMAAPRSSYAEKGASARQMIEDRLQRGFERLNPGSIVIIDESTFGLSPKRQEEYMNILQRFAKEKDLIVIAPENSGCALNSDTDRIDLEDPSRGLHLPENRDLKHQVEEVPVEERETPPVPTIEFAINHEILNQLAEDNEKFRPMLESFAGLPSSLDFGAGKTEIYADNGGGKTTLLGAMHLLLEIEHRTQGYMQSYNPRNEKRDEEAMRRDLTDSLVSNPYQVTDRAFIESIGFAKELIESGAISLPKVPVMPKQRMFSEREGISNNMWINLLDVSGKIKADHYRVIEYTKSEDAPDIAREIRRLRPDRTEGSTRQTSEALLLETIQYMPEGGFIFVDEIDGGISPGRQLEISELVHRKAQEKGITLIATSNSYEGYQYRLTPSLDLNHSEQGVISPSHKRVEEAALSAA